MNTKRIVYTLFFTFLFWLFVFAGYGVVDFFHFQKEKKIYTKKLISLKEKKENLLELVRAISEPDIDLLETQVRKILALVRKNEEIYFWR